MGALSAAAIALFSAKTLKTVAAPIPRRSVGHVRCGPGLDGRTCADTHASAKQSLPEYSRRGNPSCERQNARTPLFSRKYSRLTWQETSLFALCVLATMAMMFVRGFDDKASTLWTTMLAIQSLPYAATLITARVSAASYRQIAKSPHLTLIAAARPTAGDPC